MKFMTFDGKEDLERALETLGAVLEARGLSYTLLLIGAGSLMLIDLLARPTRDLDIVALATPSGYETAAPLPEPLADAVRDTARTLGLAEDWLNAGPTSLLDFGLPPGFEERVERMRFGALEVLVLGRKDQVATKLYAAVDMGPGSKHAADLPLLSPTPAELIEAARWVRTHDPSEAFLQELRLALPNFGAEVGDAEL